MTNAPPLSFEAPDPRPAAQPKLPVCPHCNQDPAHVAGTITRLGGLTVAIVFCENCRKIHGAFPFPLPAAPAPPPGPQLWIPR